MTKCFRQPAVHVQHASIAACEKCAAPNKDLRCGPTERGAVKDKLFPAFISRRGAASGGAAATDFFRRGAAFGGAVALCRPSSSI